MKKLFLKNYTHKNEKTLLFDAQKLAIIEDSKDFHSELILVSESHKKIAKEMESFLSGLEKVSGRLSSFVNKILVDAWNAAHKYQQCRIIYDQYREELENAEARTKSNKFLIAPDVEKAKSIAEVKKKEMEKAAENLKIKIILLHQKKSEDVFFTLEMYNKTFQEFFAKSKEILSNFHVDQPKNTEDLNKLLNINDNEENF